MLPTENGNEIVPKPKPDTPSSFDDEGVPQERFGVHSTPIRDGENENKNSIKKDITRTQTYTLLPFFFVNRSLTNRLKKTS